MGKNSILSLCLSLQEIGLSFLTPRLLRLINIGFEKTPVSNTISPSSYKYGYPAAACISIDFEHLLDESGQRSLNSKGTLATLKLAEDFEIPMTWAICGKTVKTNRRAYNQILKSKINHDIGAHTFDHIDLSDSNLEKSNVIDDISKCIKLPGLRIRPVSFIFPFNREGYYQDLKNLGFIAYRSKKRIIGYPVKKEGLWRIPPVYYLDESSGDFDTAKRLIDLSIAYGQVFHLWFHPRSLAKKGDVQRYVNLVLKPILEYLHQKNLEGKIWICTMRELANYCEARENCNIKVTQDGAETMIDIKCQTSDSRFDSPPQVTIHIPYQEKKSYIKILNDDTSNSQIRPSEKNSELFIHLTFDKSEKHIKISSNPMQIAAS